MSIVTIQGQDRVVKVSKEKSATQLFTVKNATGRMLRVGTRLTSENSDMLKWLSIEPKGEIDLDEKTATEVKVVIQPPQSADPKQYQYKLVVFNANETAQYTQSETAYFEALESNKPPCTWCWIAAIAAAVLLVLGIVLYLAWPHAGAMPGLVGKKWADAKRQLDALKVNYSIAYTVVDLKDYSGQLVKEQTPPAGTKVGKNTQAQITLASPNFVNGSLNKAKQVVAELGKAADIKTQTAGEFYSFIQKRNIAGVTDHMVVTQEPPAGQAFEDGAQVTLTVDIPNITAAALDDVKNYLSQIGVAVKNTALTPVNDMQARQIDADVKLKGKDVVMGISVGPAELLSASEVDLTLAAVIVPLVVNKTAMDGMTSIINTAGLRLAHVDYKRTSLIPQNGKVIGSTPNQNQLVKMNTDVTLTVGRFGNLEIFTPLEVERLRRLTPPTLRLLPPQ